MTPDEINITLSVLAMLLLGQSWYIHYRVKDGIARIILLWVSALLFLMFMDRAIIYAFLDGSKLFNQINFYLLYVIVVGQWYLQKGRIERNQSDKALKDKKDLNKFRKDDK